MRRTPNAASAAPYRRQVHHEYFKSRKCLSPLPAEAVSNSTGAATERSFSSEIDGATFFSVGRTRATFQRASG